MITYPFLGVTRIDESLASLALERLLGIRDPSIDTAAGLLNLASFDADGTMDPALHALVLSDSFIEQLAKQTAVGGGSDELFCPAAFTTALTSYVTRFPDQGPSLLANSYTIREASSHG